LHRELLLLLLLLLLEVRVLGGLHRLKLGSPQAWVLLGQAWLLWVVRVLRVVLVHRRLLVMLLLLYLLLLLLLLLLTLHRELLLLQLWVLLLLLLQGLKGRGGRQPPAGGPAGLGPAAG